MAKSVRRVITGKNENGRSEIISDADAATVLEGESAPVYLIELWKTYNSPAESGSKNSNDNDDQGWTDPVDGPVIISPGANGSLFRICEFPPLSEVSGADWGEALSAMGQHHDEGADIASGYHKTATVDYIVILEGEIHCLLQEGETRLKAGDTFVQRGTLHAWENRSDATCRFVSVLVGAEPR
jgi:hypothetical protein